MSRRDLTGLRFGNLVVEKLSHKAEGTSRWYWICRCDCGSVRHFAGAQLVSRGDGQGCGCRRRNNGPTPRHGHSVGGRVSLTLASYRQMVRRCTEIGRPDGDRYIGRGISIAAEWLGPRGFQRFLEHVGERPSDRHSLDRINNDGHYEPGNVRWATASEQNRNTRRTRLDSIGRMQVRWLIVEAGYKRKWVREAFGVGKHVIECALRENGD